MRKLLITGAALLSITGCASTLDGERARLSSSETIEQQRVPFEANLDKVNGKWDLDFAERGDVMYDHVRGLWIHRAAELPSMGCIRGFLGLTAKERCAKNMGIPYGEWVESDPGADMLSNVLVTPVVTALSPFGLLNAALGGENNFMWGFLGIGSDHQFSWKGFADSLEQAKENEAGSVEEYDRQLASLLRDLHQLEQEVAAFNESRRAAEYYSAQAEDHTKAKFAELKADAGRALNLQV